LLNNEVPITLNMKTTTILSVFLFLFLSLPIEAQMIVVGDSISPDLTYVDIPDTTLPFEAKHAFWVDIDIDMDSIKDIRFFRSHESSPGFQCVKYSVGSLNTIQFVVLDSATADIDPLLPGTILDNSAYWNKHYNGGYFYYYFASIPPPPFGDPPVEHGICTHPNTYIGFRKINTDDTLYGWFNLDLLDPYVLKRFAVNKRFDGPYCTPIYNTGCVYGDGLTLFQLGTINQEIPCSGTPYPWYHDYTAISTNLAINTTYIMTVQAGNSSTYVKVWIDLNNNDTFESTEIMVDNLLVAGSNTNFTAPITIPAGTSPGNHRLRYRTNWLFGVSEACAILEYGNSCDFTVNAGDNTGIDNATVSGLTEKCYPNPSSSILNILLNENISGEVLIKVFDTYGKAVKSIAVHHQQQGNDILQFSVEDLSSGLYFYSIDGQSKHYSGKFIVSR
jgi:hypothetical protein